MWQILQGKSYTENLIKGMSAHYKYNAQDNRDVCTLQILYCTQDNRDLCTLQIQYLRIDFK